MGEMESIHESTTTASGGTEIEPDEGAQVAEAGGLPVSPGATMDAAALAPLLAEAGAGLPGADERLAAGLHTALSALLRARLATTEATTCSDAAALVQDLWIQVAGTVAPEPGTGTEQETDLASGQNAARALYPKYLEHAAGAMQRLIRAHASLAARRQVADSGQVDAVATALASLDSLAELEPRLARIVQLRWFGGLGSAGIAGAQHVSELEIERAWDKARAFLAAVASAQPEPPAGEDRLMRAHADAAAWARLSALFDTGCELPPELCEGWLDSLTDEEPVVRARLRAMLADAQTREPGDALERGPVLPTWPDENDGAVAGGETASVRAESVPAEDAEGTASEPSADAHSLTDPPPGPEREPRLLAPALATGMRLGPWLLTGPMPASDVRVAQWRARRVDEEPAGRETTLLVPHQWRPRPDLAAWLSHVAARPIALEHPCIARLLEVGVADDGTPWLAAELAEGQPIDRWCREHPLELHERRSLMEQAVEAAAFAHARLVLHGQIHPSQVVVTAQRHLHWLNFGLNEILALLDTPRVAEVPVAGGPPPRAYVAPELLGGSTGAVAATVGGDVHALGLVLFEVLSGASPWQPRPSGHAPAAAGGTSRWPRPSDLVGTSKLRRALRGDLDAIVAKSTHADPAQRYLGLGELLDDLRRAGAHRPVTAMDGGFLYQAGCIARRHPRWSSAAAVCAILCAVFLAGLSWKAWTWTLEREQAEAALRSAEAVNRLLQDLLQDGTRAGAERDWPTLLGQAESMARASLKEQPAGLASALALLGRRQVEHGAFAEGRNLLAEALPQLASPVEQLEAGCDESWAQARQGDRVEEAEQRLRRVTENVAVRPVTRVLCMARLADLERRSGRRLDAYLTSLEAWKQWEVSMEKPPQLALLLARPMGLQCAALGRFHESQLWFEWALKHAEVLRQDKGLVGIQLREQWGEVSLAAGDAERAMRLADTNLSVLTGNEFPADDDIATAPPALLLFAAAEPRLELHRIPEARARLERVVALSDARGDQPMRQRARCLLALGALRERDTAAATRWLKAIPADAAAANAALGGGNTVGSTSVAVAGAALLDLEREATRTAAREADQFCRAVSAELSLQQGLANEAYREADRLINSASELTPRMSASVMLLRAEALMSARQYDRALSAALQALQQARALHQSDIDDQKARPSFRSGQAALVLADAHRATGDIEAATKTLDYALQQLTATLPEGHPWRRRAEATKGALAVHTKKP